MFDIFDRNFVDVNETEKALNVPAMTGADGKLMRGLTQENTEMNRRVENERRRAEHAEKMLSAKIDSLHDYTFQPALFGGSWSESQYLDSVSIINASGETVAQVMLPIIQKTGHDYEDEALFMYYKADADRTVPYFLQLDNRGTDSSLRIAGIWKPKYDTEGYTVGASVKTLPWLLTA